MAKDFDFQMPVSKLTIEWQSQQQQLIVSKLYSYEVGWTQVFAKLENLSIHQVFNLSKWFFGLYPKTKTRNFSKYAGD